MSSWLSPKILFLRWKCYIKTFEINIKNIYSSCLLYCFRQISFMNLKPYSELCFRRSFNNVCKCPSSIIYYDLYMHEVDWFFYISKLIVNQSRSSVIMIISQNLAWQLTLKYKKNTVNLMHIQIIVNDTRRTLTYIIKRVRYNNSSGFF